ncbi:MAG: YbjN domain-containing protein [Erythrobacter sp.]|nr:YbjN domain-containing protein [Erythrobacter sp.]
MAVAPGSAAGADDDTPRDTFSRADLIAALEANGASWEELADSRSIDVTLASGTMVNALLMACTDEDLEYECYGSSFLATFTREGLSDAQVTEAINEYNYRENFGRAYVDPDGTVSVRLYLISDGGITPGHFARQIELWGVSLSDFFDYLYGPVEEDEGA